MFKFKHTSKVIDAFGDQVVNRAKKNLNTTGFRDKGRKISPSGSTLYDSISQEIKETKEGFIQEFGSSTDYAPFVEEGRKKGKFVPIKPLMEYIKKKKIRLRRVRTNANGQTINEFVPMTEKNIKSAAFGMSINIKRKGIKPSNFFGEALDTEFDKLPPELQDAYTQDLADFSYEDFKKQGLNTTIQ